MSLAILKPGVLVHLSISVNGGVHYSRTDLPAPDDATQEWKTAKTVDDAEELAAAGALRTKARTAIEKICTKTNLGCLLCPTDRVPLLNVAIQEHRDAAHAFNGTAKYCHITICVFRGQVAETDSEATQAIATDLRACLAEMKNAVLVANVAAIRAAAKQAQNLAVMLDERSEAAQTVSTAVSAARESAKEIVKRLLKGAQQTEEQVATMTAIDAAEMKLLEVEAPGEATTLPEGWTQPKAANLDLLEAE